MPGNNGGSNWGSTSANPTNGTVYVISYDIPAIMRLLTPEEAAARGNRRGRGAVAAGSPGLAVFQQNCVPCHGADRAGTANGAPLIGVTTRLSPNEIREMVTNGRGRMPGLPHVTQPEIESIVAYLTAADSGGRGGAGRGAGAGPMPTFPPGPVVQSGPAATRPAGVDRAGNLPTVYPEGAEAPAERYTMNGYGLYSNIVKPPYTTLTSVRPEQRHDQVESAARG